MPFGAAAILGGTSLLGSIFGGSAASDAADAQSKAATKAADLQLNEFNTAKDLLSPYSTGGKNSLASLNTLLGIRTDGTLDTTAPLQANPLTALGPAPQYNMPQYDASTYRQSPGYAFTLQGGTDALRNAGATRTGALSGNVLKALQGYGSGLANQDYWKGYDAYATDYLNQYNSKYNNYWNTYSADEKYNQDLFNNLYNVASLGENAAAGTGSLAVTAGANAGNAIIGAGNAKASGIVGSSNAYTGGLNSLSTLLNSPTNSNSLLSNLFGSTSTGSYVDANGNPFVY